MKRVSPILLFAVMVLVPTVAHAKLIVSFGPSLSLPVGTDGLLDVFIRSDSLLGEPLQSMAVTFQISGPGLTFFKDGLGNPDEPQLTDPNYVFAGNTSSNMGSVSNDQDAYSQLDFTANSLDVTVPSTNVLLATLHLVAGSAGPYSITIDPSNTVFYPADLLEPAIAYTVENVGSVTVTGTITVPEPTCLNLFGFGALALAAAFRTRSGNVWFS